MVEFESPGAFILLLLVPVVYILRHIKVLSRITFDLIMAFIWVQTSAGTEGQERPSRFL